MDNWERSLAAAAAAVRVKEVSPPVRDRLLALLMHDLVSGAAASHQPAAIAAARLASAWGGTGSIRLLATGEPAGLLGAVFANTTCLTASRLEDFWGALHLGPVLIAPALALAETEGRTGTDVLEALAAGLGAAIAMARRWNGATAGRGFRGTPLYGQLGAAVTAGRLLGLDNEGLLRALAFAAVSPSGTVGSLLDGTSEWQFEAGQAAVQGTMAALLARDHSLPTSPAPLTGRGAFAAAFAGADPSVPGPAAPTPHDLAQAVLEVGLKQFPVHVFCLSPVAAALQLCGRKPMDPAVIASVELQVPAGEVAAISGRGPFAMPLQAGLSAPTLVAVALTRGTFGSEEFAAVNDPAVQALAGRVHVVGAPDLTPQTARLRVQADGRTAEAAVTDPDPLYRPNLPEVGRRMSSLAGAAAEAAVARLLNAVGSLAFESAGLPGLLSALSELPLRHGR